VPGESATVVTRLLRAGAIVVMDPNNVWKEDWGELYTPLDD
jgi:hypothetical protein